MTQLTLAEELAQEAEMLESAPIAPDQLTAEALDQKLTDLRALDDKYKEMKAELDKVGDLVDARKFELLNILDALNRPNYTLPGVGMASKVTEKRYKLPEDVTARETIFKYINDNYGKEALYGYTTINAAKFNTFVNEEVAQCKSVPGVGAPTINTYVKFLRR